MEYREYKELLYKAFEENGLSDILSEENTEKLYRFSNILVETNKTFNLTAITEEKEVILKHFVDCASISKHIPSGSTLIDVGCGAGFPSLPIAILRNDIKATSLDSTAKKIDFINRTAKELSLDNIVAISARAEDFAKNNREKFDVATSRAVARLNILDELCLPLVKVGGLFIAMKSSRGEIEYSEAKTGIDKLGSRLELVEKGTLSFEEMTIERETYIFKKVRQTPNQYPRNYSQIVKKPL
jgi:16S rRNA (guanine527-N7)-methyltransferase